MAVQTSTASKLRTLAKHLHFLQDRHRVYSRMCCTDPDELNISLKIMTAVNYESAIVNLKTGNRAQDRRLALRVFLAALAESTYQEANNVLHEIRKLVKSKFADKDTQDRVILHYTDNFQKNSPTPHKRGDRLKTS